MKKFLCYDTNDAASGKINVDNRGMLKPNSTVPSGSTPYQQLVTDGDGNAKWEDRLAYSETIEWDGNAEGKETVGPLVLLKKIPGITLEKVAKGTFEGILISTLPFETMSEDIYMVAGAFILVTKGNASADGLTLPYAGIYVNSSYSPFTLRIPLETIREEYIPNNYRVVFIANKGNGFACNCSYDELKSFILGNVVPILGTIYVGTTAFTMINAFYTQDLENIRIQFYDESGRLKKIDYAQDGSIVLAPS